MSSIFCAISFIKNVTGTTKICNGTAVYKTGSNDFVEYKFKAFRLSETSLVEEITKSSISLVIGRFVFNEKELNVMIEQHTPLNVRTIEDFPTMYDLPVSPAFGVFTAPLQDPVTTNDDNAFFRLKRDSYNGVTSSKITMSVLCKYDPRGRHSNVADNIKRSPVISVAGELVTLKRSVCILGDVIEWTYPGQGNSSTSEDKAPAKNRKRRNEELEKLVEKFEAPVLQRYKGKEKLNENIQEERCEITDTENQDNTIDLTQNNEIPTEHLHTEADNCLDDLCDDDENSEILEED
ncbi:16780_t:CDS:2 [Cetraspora pellucida]|uniref:16780_t:CDS:1 n=1 Tax=Cetraspora pellucida TaxID=1433469 RepID=A0ACA9K672_9GLOM|nr:16780_t:CDS:2 [Cetraspora pellucida]